jgi:hypothetical protein
LRHVGHAARLPARAALRNPRKFHMLKRVLEATQRFPAAPARGML